MSEFQITVAEALKIHPGDRLLLQMPGCPTPLQMEQMRQAFAERFPGVEFVLLAGVEEIAVLAADA